MNILIVGATSAIASACARRWAKAGASFFLTGRDSLRLDQLSADLRGRGAKATFVFTMDVTHVADQRRMLAAAADRFECIDVALIAYGTLTDQAVCERDGEKIRDQMEVNCVSVMTLLSFLARQLEAQGHGTLAVITSVAGERGRRSNYIYGSAKAGLSTFCEGLNARLSRAGARVVDIRPGFIRTPMTSDIAFPAVLSASSEAAAQRITTGLNKRASVLYVPWFWRLIMLVIRMIPTRIFNRMNF